MMSRRIKLAVLVHEGSSQTNLKAIRAGIETGKINVELHAVVSDAENLEGKLDDVDYICLAGWKKIIPNDVLTKFENKILNIHPGLIPDKIDGEVLAPDGSAALWNKGMYADKAIQNFLDQKATYAGSSIHFLTSEFDFGPVLGRTFEKINTDDTVESLYARLKKKENELYVDVLAKLTHA